MPPECLQTTAHPYPWACSPISPLTTHSGPLTSCKLRTVGRALGFSGRGASPSRASGLNSFTPALAQPGEAMPGKSKLVGPFVSSSLPELSSGTGSTRAGAEELGSRFGLFSNSVVSDSLRPHGLWPARLLCPWDFPGKNTGVGCRFLLQGIFLSRGSKPSLLHWQAGSLLLSHLGSPGLGLRLEAGGAEGGREEKPAEPSPPITCHPLTGNSFAPNRPCRSPLHLRVLQGGCPVCRKPGSRLTRPPAVREPRKDRFPAPVATTSLSCPTASSRPPHQGSGLTLSSKRPLDHSFWFVTL